MNTSLSKVLTGDILLKIEMMNLLIGLHSPSIELKEHFKRLIPIYNNIVWMKFKPMVYYPAHQDSVRGCAINIFPETFSESRCYFVFASVPSSGTIMEIPYRKNIPMLIDTKQTHFIINNVPEPRIFLSISFIDSYDDIKEYFNSFTISR